MLKSDCLGKTWEENFAIHVVVGIIFVLKVDELSLDIGNFQLKFRPNWGRQTCKMHFLWVHHMATF